MSPVHGIVDQRIPGLRGRRNLFFSTFALMRPGDTKIWQFWGHPTKLPKTIQSNNLVGCPRNSRVSPKFTRIPWTGFPLSMEKWTYCPRIWKNKLGNLPPQVAPILSFAQRSEYDSHDIGKGTGHARLRKKMGRKKNHSEKEGGIDQDWDIVCRWALARTKKGENIPRIKAEP